MSAPGVTVEITANVNEFTTAIEKAQTQFAEFLMRVLADPEAAAAFRKAQLANPVPLPGGAYYRARARRRTRSHR